MRILPVSLSEPATEPVTLGQLRGQVRVDDMVDDAMLYGWAIAARQRVEGHLSRPVVSRAVRATFYCWPRSYSLFEGGFAVGGRIDTTLELLMPVTSVDAITVDGVAWTDFIARTSPGQVTRVQPKSGYDWPALAADPVITLDATAGFTVVPEAIIAAICLLVGHYYQNREAVLFDFRGIATELPEGVRALLGPYRWTWLG